MTAPSRNTRSLLTKPPTPPPPSASLRRSLTAISPRMMAEKKEAVPTSCESQEKAARGVPTDVVPCARTDGLSDTRQAVYFLSSDVLFYES